MGLNTSSLIGNTYLQQPNLGYYSWLSASQKLPLYNQQFNFTNPFTKNKTLGDQKNYLNNLPQQPQQQQNPLDYLSFLQNGSGALSQAVGQIDSTIQSNSSSPVTKAISSAVTGIGRNVLSSVGQNVGGEVAKQLGTSTLKEGFKNLSTSGLKSAAKSGLSKAFSTASLGGVALSVANQFAPQKREYSGDKGNLTKGLDNAYNKAILNDIRLITDAEQYDTLSNYYKKLHNTTFDKVIIYNNRGQCSGELDLITVDKQSLLSMSNTITNDPTKSRIYKNEGIWQINNFTDLVSNYNIPLFISNCSYIERYLDKKLNIAAIDYSKYWGNKQPFRDSNVSTRLMFTEHDNIKLSFQYYLTNTTKSIK